MSLMFQPLKKYAEFKGRASRSEYWLFFLLNFLLGIGASILTAGDSTLVTLVWLALLIPNIALGSRRLHDINMSAWWLLISLVPFLGALVLLIFALIPGTEGDNRFGADPRLDTAE